MRPCWKRSPCAHCARGASVSQVELQRCGVLELLPAEGEDGDSFTYFEGLSFTCSGDGSVAAFLSSWNDALWQPEAETEKG